MIFTLNKQAKLFEARRLKAGIYFKQGKTQAWVANKLNVTTAATCQWYAMWKSSRDKGLKSKGNCGVHSPITEYKLKKIIQTLEKGPLKAGFDSDMWTLERVRRVVKRETKQDYHIGHIWKILTETVGWTNQKPKRKARERNESAIARWVKNDWPRIKKKP